LSFFFPFAVPEDLLKGKKKPQTQTTVLSEKEEGWFLFYESKTESISNCVVFLIIHR